MIRAKFMLQEHRIIGHGPTYQSNEFVFRPQYDSSIPEDKRFASATPTGELRISVDNPIVVEMWRGALGTNFYLDLARADTVER